MVPNMIWLIFIYAYAILTPILTLNLGKITSGHPSLEVLHILFRHGDRTPDTLYPEDIYTSDSFFPEGIGQLTNKGKSTAYNIGLTVRKKYDAFLGDVYFPELLYGLSSHYGRTKASLALMLAALFPPREEQIWNPNITWQPIPCDYLSENENTVFFPMTACPNFQALFQDGFDTHLLNDSVYLKYENNITYLQKASGFNYTNLFLMGKSLYSTLKSEHEYGLQLPNWTAPVYPDILKELSANFWKFYTATHELKIISPGYLLSKIMENTNMTVNGTMPKRKLYLYAGHDSNIVSLLGLFGRFVPHNPNYGAYIIVEVHKALGLRYLRILYENYAGLTRKAVYIPNCGIYCPMETFKKLYADQLDAEKLRIVCGK